MPLLSASSAKLMTLAATIQPAEAATMTMGNHLAGFGVCVRVMVLMSPWPAM